MGDQRAFVLPTSIVSPTDVSRLLREIESVATFFQEAEIRQGGDQQGAMPRLSKLMDSLATENKINLLQKEHREFLQQSLEYLHGSAPVVHVSFSVDPPGSYTQKIVAWMRANIHGTVLMTVGLQPNIGAGCVVRTTNRIFDFSLREYFHEKRDFFIHEMHKAIVDQPDGVDSEKPAATVEDTRASEVPVAAPTVVQQAEPQVSTPVVSQQPVESQEPTPVALAEPPAPEAVEQTTELPAPVVQEEVAA